LDESLEIIGIWIIFEKLFLISKIDFKKTTTKLTIFKVGFEPSNNE
jgi:hypothetical protein